MLCGKKNFSNFKHRSFDDGRKLGKEVDSVQNQGQSAAFPVFSIQLLKSSTLIIPWNIRNGRGEICFQGSSQVTIILQILWYYSFVLNLFIYLFLAVSQQPNRVFCSKLAILKSGLCYIRWRKESNHIMWSLLKIRRLWKISGQVNLISRLMFLRFDSIWGHSRLDLVFSFEFFDYLLWFCLFVRLVVDTPLKCAILWLIRILLSLLALYVTFWGVESGVSVTVFVRFWS